MNRLFGIIAALMLVMSVPVTIAAHEVTHKGTAIALKVNKYAQPTGPAREVTELEVTVVDPKTKKTAYRVFTITQRTRVLRDGKRIQAADAAVQKGEEVAVVVEHDKPGDEAIELRLTTKKKS